MSGQNTGTCDFTVPTTFSDILNVFNGPSCDVTVTGNLHTSSEEITSHQAGGSLLVCGNSGASLTTVQSDRFVDFLPGFYMPDATQAFEARTGECGANPPTCTMVGLPCDEDNDVCTTAGSYDANCDCVGQVFQDSDNDTVCDANDVCPGFDDTVDTDNDGIPNGCDSCPNSSDNSMNIACDDLDPCTINDVMNCGVCAGTLVPDTNNDGFCDADADNDGSPDVFDVCVGQEGSCIGYNLDEFDCFDFQTFNNIADDFSGVTYNPSRDRFMAVQNSPTIAYEIHRTGFIIREIELDGFNDTEGIVYISGDTYAISEERKREIVFVEIPLGDQDSEVVFDEENIISLTNIPCEDEGTVDEDCNQGLEGLSYDAVNDILYVAKEKDPMAVYAINNPLGRIGDSFAPNELFDLQDLSGDYPNNFDDIAGLSFSMQNSLIMLTEDGESIVEVNAFTGELISSLDIGYLVMNQPEGITIIDQNHFVVVGEPNEFVIVEREDCDFRDNLTTTTSRSLAIANVSANSVDVYPNPFSHQMKIEVDLLADGPMRIDVIDVSGRLVKKVVERDEARKGNHVFDVDGVDLETGLYFVRVQAGAFTETKKITKL